MNYKYTLHQFALLMIGLALGEFVVGLFALIQLLIGAMNEVPAVWALMISAVIGILGGVILRRFTKTSNEKFGSREALLLVSMVWFIGAALACLPYSLWAWIAKDQAHVFHSPVDAYFEAMSGLTTTGATVLSDIHEIPPSLLLWRSMTHWFGGLGIVVLFVAVLPSLGVGGKKLFKVEAPGPTQEGVRPHIRETARVLWLIYTGFTLLEIAMLWIAGMSLFDAVCHTMATLATGGFSTKNASVGHYHDISWLIDVIVIVFMFLAGVNFALYFHVIRGKWKNLFRDTEFRVYVSIIGIATLLVVGSLLLAQTDIFLTNNVAVEQPDGEQARVQDHDLVSWSDPWSYPQALRQGLFQVVSIMTTTGFGTADFTKWPFLAQAVLVSLMFVGGCAGSTGGGIKVIRIWLVLRILWSQVELAFRPNVIRPLRLGKSPIKDEMKLSVLSYVATLCLIMALGGVLLMVIEELFGDGTCDFTTAITASASTLFNVGPGLGAISPVDNYGWFSLPSKVLMCLLMAIGRLEFFAVVVLFTPKFWKTV